jgi:uncharacterized membrane protein
LSTETGRVEAFSDGVFAIAITLLILNIKVPAPGAGRLWPQLIAQWPSYFSFVISFAFIGIMWINHHRLFTHIHQCDNGLLVLNLALLFGVTFVPFPTAVLAAHLGHADERAAVTLFNSVYFVIAIIFNLLWRYAALRPRHLLAHDVDRHAVDHITRQYSLGPLMYLICLVAGWFSPITGLLLNCALAVFFALPPSFRPSSSQSIS